MRANEQSSGEFVRFNPKLPEPFKQSPPSSQDRHSFAWSELFLGILTHISVFGEHDTIIVERQPQLANQSKIGR
jgi:hypothetical protein